MHIITLSDKEFKQHNRAIQSIADQFHIKEELIRDLYEKILFDLLPKAKLKKYLSVLVTKRVKELL